MSPIVRNSVWIAVFLASSLLLSDVHADGVGDAAEIKDAATRSVVASENSRAIDEETSAVLARVKAGSATVADHIRLGYLLVEKGSLDDAMHSFNDALIINPRSSEAKTGRGIVLARQGHLKEAEEVLKDALLLNPDPVRTHYELGLVYGMEGNLEKAVSEFKDGIKKHEQDR